jgi:hypothetical protein
VAAGAEEVEVAELVAAAVAERDAMVHLEPPVQAAADAAPSPVDASADLASCRLTSAYRSRSPVRSDRSNDFANFRIPLRTRSRASLSHFGPLRLLRHPRDPRWRHLVLYDDDHCGGCRPLLGHVSGMARCVGSRSRRTLGVPPLDRGQQNRKTEPRGGLRIVRPAAWSLGERG